jgi:hypothetical protein
MLWDFEIEPRFCYLEQSHWGNVQQWCWAICQKIHFGLKVHEPILADRPQIGCILVDQAHP